MAFWICIVSLRHCFICCPPDSTVSGVLGSWFLTACRCGHLSPQIWDSLRKETVNVLSDTRLSSSKTKILCHLQTVQVTGGVIGSGRKYINLVNVEGQNLKIRIFFLFYYEICFSDICIVFDREIFKLSGIWHWKLPTMLFYKDFVQKWQLFVRKK